MESLITVTILIIHDMDTGLLDKAILQHNRHIMFREGRGASHR